MSSHDDADVPFEARLYRVAQVRAIERQAIAELGGAVLMRRAAIEAFRQLRARWPQARSIAVWCGPGNNGGDGFLLAALAHRQDGLVVTAYALADTAQGDAAEARALCERQGVAIRPVPAELPQADVHVDAIYGIGLNRAPEAAVARLIGQLNASGRPILAIDVPSGLDADTGCTPGAAIRASATVSFLAAKRGMATGMAADHVGELLLDALDVSTDEPPDACVMRAGALPVRPRVSHKGEQGDVLAIGGEHGTAGAIRLCGEAALRVGAGLVTVATRQDNLIALNAARPELMAHAVETPATLRRLLDQADVLAVGPGLGQAAWGRALWEVALSSDLPMVLDADGLNLLAKFPRVFDRPVALTPHPGEAARLLGTDIGAIQADRYAAARELARRYGVIVVLKGSGSLVADPSGRVEVCPWGNPGMASGGMGDLLTGAIAGVFGQCRDMWRAACLGVALHARAGDRAAAVGGERGLLAMDLLAPLRALSNGTGHG